MTKYVVTKFGVIWCFSWLGAANAFLISSRENVILNGWLATFIYFVMTVFPCVLMLWNDVATKLGLHKEVQS